MGPEKNASTYLRTLSNCLSGRSKKIFPNQVVFYNAIFGATDPNLLPEEYLDPMCRLGRGQRSPGDEEWIKEVTYLLRSGLDSNSANIGKHINNTPELPIPRQHKSHYLVPENRNDIIRRLEAVIWFSIAFHPGKYRLEQEDYRVMLRQMQEELIQASPTVAERSGEDLTVEMLALILYEVVMSHLSGLQNQGEEESDDGPLRKASFGGKSSVDYHRQYAKQIECHSAHEAKRFYALKALAETNAVAAFELGNVYFYGAQYVDRIPGSEEGIPLTVHSDPSAAAMYYKLAASLALSIRVGAD